MGFWSWLLSNILGFILVIILALFLFAVFATYVFAPIGSDLGVRVATLGPCIAAGIVASIVGGLITRRLRDWLEAP